MPTWLIVLFSDLRDAILLTELVDLTLPMFFGLWLVILFMPLIGIDRRDPNAGAVFVLYCVASGAALVFALPQQFLPHQSFETQAIALFCMACAATVRWSVGYFKQRT